eukprot:CAMPEP_0175160548 /NCGR_PEP_ID=MMETSP0087-20121206/24088_1 /TAXON_ID=136419 /ORGANISM="Unknown Unknown, Strain D1" /LENGTH=482 /DNA_ID=CAMNT_0016448819 /DNA_START=100 /DNA_END=1545 /DNA_ORIENTATION=-
MTGHGGRGVRSVSFSGDGCMVVVATTSVVLWDFNYTLAVLGQRTLDVSSPLYFSDSGFCHYEVQLPSIEGQDQKEPEKEDCSASGFSFGFSLNMSAETANPVVPLTPSVAPSWTSCSDSTSTPASFVPGKTVKFKRRDKRVRRAANPSTRLFGGGSGKAGGSAAQPASIPASDATFSTAFSSLSITTAGFGGNAHGSCGFSGSTGGFGSSSGDFGQSFGGFVNSLGTGVGGGGGFGTHPSLPRSDSCSLAPSLGTPQLSWDPSHDPLLLSEKQGAPQLFWDPFCDDDDQLPASSSPVDSSSSSSSPLPPAPVVPSPTFLAPSSPLPPGILARLTQFPNFLAASPTPLLSSPTPHLNQLLSRLSTDTEAVQPQTATSSSSSPLSPAPLGASPVPLSATPLLSSPFSTPSKTKRKLADTSSDGSDSADTGSPGKKPKTSEHRRAQYRKSSNKRRAKAKRHENFVEELSQMVPALKASETRGFAL